MAHTPRGTIRQRNDAPLSRLSPFSQIQPYFDVKAPVAKAGSFLDRLRCLNSSCVLTTEIESNAQGPRPKDQHYVPYLTS